MLPPVRNPGQFGSYYRATAKGSIRDSITFRTVSEPEPRFHYSASENAIIRCLTRHTPAAMPSRS